MLLLYKPTMPMFCTVNVPPHTLQSPHFPLAAFEFVATSVLLQVRNHAVCAENLAATQAHSWDLRVGRWSAALVYIAVRPLEPAAAEELLPSPPRAIAEGVLPSPPPAAAAEDVLPSPPCAAVVEVLLLPSRSLVQLKHRQALRPPQSGLWLAQSRSWHARVQYRT
jgi:hypothetical protein